MKLNKIFNGVLLVTCGLSAVCPGLASAAGIYLPEMSNVSEAGYAGAGLVARANDAGTVFTNPAGMTRFDSSELIAGFTGVYIHGPYQTTNAPPLGGNTKTVKNFIPAGSAAYVYPLSDRLMVGVSAQNNFGLALDFDDEWAGRYSAVKVALVAPQVQPTVAYKVNDWLSVGAGAALTLGFIYDKARIAVPGGSDGKLRYSDADFAVQGNLGIMIEPSDRTRIGLRYLTETDLDFEDAPNLSGIPNSGARTELDLGLNMPQSIMAGIHHQVNDKWALLGSFGWEEWSKFGKIKVEADVAGGISTRADADFRDTWHFGIGTEYQYDPKWTLTAGISYDTSMQTDRTGPIDLPMAALYRYGVGFKYKAKSDLTLGGGFTLLYQGTVAHKETLGVSGKFQPVTISFLSFYGSWQ